MIIDRAFFHESLARAARTSSVSDTDILFRHGLDISSLAFTEFVLRLEEKYALDIDPDALDADIMTVGQLYEVLSEIASKQTPT